ncbi:MAG: PqqD family protein [Actinomycetota bacterium]
MPESAYALTDRPRAVDDVEIAAFDGEIVVFHVGPSVVHKLPGAIGAVWLMCDGETTVAELSPQLTELFGLADDDGTDLDQTVHSALTQLARNGLLAGQGVVATRVEDDVATRASDGSEIFVAPPDP